ncbi:MAG: 1,4-dihydroxy-2-naphthoyl-CoA hydrolase in menaquinone biosynthesis, partial [uncultured Rubrobacteraceae bacterium]
GPGGPNEERRGRDAPPRPGVCGAHAGAGGGDDARGREAPPAVRVPARRGERGARRERGERRRFSQLPAGQGGLWGRDQREPRPPQEERHPDRRWRPGAPRTHEPGVGGPHYGRERQDGLRLPLHRRRRRRRIVL